MEDRMKKFLKGRSKLQSEGVKKAHSSGRKPFTQKQTIVRGSKPLSSTEAQAKTSGKDLQSKVKQAKRYSAAKKISNPQHPVGAKLRATAQKAIKSGDSATMNKLRSIVKGARKALRKGNVSSGFRGAAAMSGSGPRKKKKDKGFR